MLRQLDIFETHQSENNSESQETLSINKESFQGQNKRVYELLMSGIQLTFSDAFIKYGISDLRRRAKDLTDNNGVLLSKKFTEGRAKVWFMDEEQIRYNKQLRK